MNKPVRILLVENQTTDVELTQREIRKSIHTCSFQRVETPEACLKALETFHPDVILSGDNLLHFDDLQVLSLAHEHAPSIPVIIWGDLSDEEIIVKCIKAGAHNYITKENSQRLGPAVLDASQDGQLIQDHKQAKGKYQTIFENSPIGIFQSSPAGNFISVNPAMARIYGYDSPEDMINTVNDITRQLYLEPGKRDTFTQLFETQDMVENYELESKRKDGSVFWTATSARAIRDDQGNILLFEGFLKDITERKRTEDELRTSQERFLQLANNIQEVFWMTDVLSGKELYISPAIEKIWGSSRESFKHDPGLFMQSVFPEDRAKVTKVIEAQRHGKKTEMEYRITRPDGTVRWIWDRAFPIYDDADKFVRVAGIAADITERKQADDAVKNRNQILLALHHVALEIGAELRLPVLLHTILEQIQSMLDADRGGGVYLYEPNENALKLVHGSGINQGRDGIIVPLGVGVAGHVYQTSKTLIVDDYTHWKNHAEILVTVPSSTVMGVPLFLSGKVIGVLTLIANSHQRKFNDQDMQQAEMFAAQAVVAIRNAQLYQQAKQELAERKQAEEALHQSEERYRQLLNFAPIGVGVHIEGRLVFANTAAARLIGATVPDELIGKPVMDFVHPDDRKNTMEALQRMLEGQTGSYPREERFIRMDGSIINVEVLATSLVFLGKPAVQVVVQDITERKRSEKEIERHLAELEALYENGLALGRLLEPHEIGKRIIDTFAHYLSWHHVTIRLLRQGTNNLDLVAFSMPHMKEGERHEVEQIFINRVSM